jgi:AcrR family transcriptional regulator
MRPTRQEHIVAAALQEFSERGYGGASIRDIAQRAGMSMSALYHYYPGKQDLLVALLNEGMESFYAACDEALADAGDSPAEQLEALVDATVRFRARHPEKSRIAASEVRSLDPENLARYTERASWAGRRLQEIVDAGVAAGDFATPYPEDARRGVLTMCNAVAQWYRPGGTITEDELAHRYVALALTLVEYRPRAARRPR